MLYLIWYYMLGVFSLLATGLRDRPLDPDMGREERIAELGLGIGSAQLSLLDAHLPLDLLADHSLEEVE